MRHGYHVEEPDLGSEFDADGSAFSVLDTERTNDGICMCFQTTHFQTLVNANDEREVSKGVPMWIKQTY